MQPILLNAVAGVFIAEGWQLVISSLNTRGIVGLVSALVGLLLGVLAGQNIKKQQRPTPLFWFSFLFHAFSLGFSDTPLSGFVSLLILGSGLPSLVAHAGYDDIGSFEMSEVAPSVVAFFIAKACAVVGLGYINKTLLAAVGLYGMTMEDQTGASDWKSAERARPASTFERREVEPFVTETDVNSRKYTPAFLASWRQMHLSSIAAPEELLTQRLEHYEPPARPATGKGKGKGKDKGDGGGKGKAGGKGLGKGKFKGDDMFNKAFDDSSGDVGEDIRWTVIAEEMARIDAESKANNDVATEG
jgi:hypothetical protein